MRTTPEADLITGKRRVESDAMIVDVEEDAKGSWDVDDVISLNILPGRSAAMIDEMVIVESKHDSCNVDGELLVQ